MIAGVPSMIVCGREMALCSTKMIADVARIIVWVAEKIESLTELIGDRMEILVSQPSTITDNVEMIGKETQLIVTTVLSKGKTENCVFSRFCFLLTLANQPRRLLSRPCMPLLLRS